MIESGYKKEADRIMKNYLEEILPDVSTQQQFIQNPPGENKGSSSKSKDWDYEKKKSYKN